MSKYLGDYAKPTGAGTLEFKFSTFRPSTGAAFSLSSGAAVTVYKGGTGNTTGQSTTLTRDWNSITGLNHVSVDLSQAFFVDGEVYEAVITTGTVDSVSVVGACVGRFTLRAQASLYPTTLGRTLDVSTTGEAGIDFGNIGSPTTTVNLSGTTIKAVTDATTVGTINSGVITATSIAADAITAAKLAADVGLEIADAVWDEAMSGHTTAGTYGGRIPRSDSSNVEVKLTGAAHIAADVHEFQPDVIDATAIAANAIDASALATDAVTEIAQGVLTEATSTNTATYAAGDVGNVLGRLHNLIEADPVSGFRYTAQALEEAPGGGPGGSWELNEDQTTGLKRMISAIVGVGGETATPGVLEFDMIGETTTLRITQSTDGNDRLSVEEV